MPEPAIEPPSIGPPGFTHEQWNDPDFGFCASAVLASALLWHQAHKHDAPADHIEHAEETLRAACVLLDRYIVDDR
jgi:hypothetical protein